MANKVVFSEEENVDLSGLEKKETEKDIDDTEIEKMFTFEPMKVEEVIKQETKVEVNPTRDFKSSFGGVWYYFTKGKKQRIPVEMRDKLLKNTTNPRIKDTW
jgi:hypothetical protein